jgi:hypothetical protein
MCNIKVLTRPTLFYTCCRIANFERRSTSTFLAFFQTWDPNRTQNHVPFPMANCTIPQFILSTGPLEGTAGEKEVHPWGLNTLPGGLEAPYWGPEAPTAPPPKRLASPSSEFYRMELLARWCS